MLVVEGVDCCWRKKADQGSFIIVANGGHLVRASESSQAASSGDDTAAAVASTIATTATTFKHLMLPIMDRNPYLSAATRQVQTM